MENGMNSMII